jgi:DNA-binding NarL/FixJ family response regulator
MGEREIIIADKDAMYRSQMAVFFREAGYRVETADSAGPLLSSVLERQVPVLLLGSDFGKQVSSSDLVHVLKKCSRHLHIIMVSDEMSLAKARQVRQEGIFFHALKPAGEGDLEELVQVVACAFEKHRESVRNDPAPAPQFECAPAPLIEPAIAEAAKSSWLERALARKSLPWVGGLVALLLGTGYFALSAVKAAHLEGNLATWIFFGFCALVITGQLLPIFRIKLKLGRAVAPQAKESAPRGGK